jgi:hypothetical protein
MIFRWHGVATDLLNIEQELGFLDFCYLGREDLKLGVTSIPI